METYLVGGAVRDELLGLTVKDRDWLVVGAEPAQLLALNFTQVGKDFPVFLHPETKEEYALARTERKSGKGYGGFVCDFHPSVTLDEDLTRRDLTINALVKDHSGEVLDLVGGLEDLKHKKLRHVSSAFVEDPLRVLRVARFYARFKSLGFSVAPETLALMRTMCEQGLLQELTAERVWIETTKAMAEVNPEAYFELLADCGGLIPWYPEIDALKPKQWQDLTILLQSFPHLSQDQRWIFRLLASSYLFPENSQSFFKRLTAPNNQRLLAEKLSLLAPQMMTQSAPSAEAALALIKGLDAFRKPEQLSSFLSLCEGIAGALSIATWDFQLLKMAHEESLKVDNKVLLDQGFTGVGLGQKIEEERLKLISQIAGIS